MTAAPALPVAPPDTVPYATPAPRPGAKVWAGAAILFGGLCLILLGGCFLIGVLALVQPTGIGFGNSGVMSPPTLSGGQIGLMMILYALAFASFGGAATLLVVGTRALIRVIWG